MLEGPRPCTSFVSHTYTMHELHNGKISIGKHQRSKQRGQDVSGMNKPNYLLYFVSLCARSTPKIKSKDIKQITLLGFITISGPLLTMVNFKTKRT